MSEQELPSGLSKKQIKEIVEHYENQTDAEALDEDEAARNQTGYAMVQVPVELVHDVEVLIDRFLQKEERGVRKSKSKY